MSESKNMSKELLSIIDALNAYNHAHDGRVAIILSVVAFDLKDNVVDDRLILEGDREIMITMFEELEEIVANEKGDAISTEVFDAE